MQVKMFMDARPETLEQQINGWLANEAGNIEVIKIETVMAPVPERGQVYPCIVVTIWYELPQI